MPRASVLPAGRPAECATRQLDSNRSRAERHRVWPRRLDLKTPRGTTSCSLSRARGWGSPLALPSFGGDNCSQQSAGKEAHASLLQFQHARINGSVIEQLNSGNGASSSDCARLIELGAGGGRGCCKKIACSEMKHTKIAAITQS